MSMDSKGFKVNMNMKRNKNRRYTISLNHKAKTYTIRVYVGNRLLAKYRSYPQGKSFTKYWTENDIWFFLHDSDEYYVVKTNVL